ncbi:hypothetical protein ACIQW9_13295 [Herminiimonas sp. NPDC097707]|uniref:hypothetical protein n=1 Tax=Herminiimonas sp. NPDC097707 TaxID=3364007 RepID=UPI00383A14EF
MHANFPANYFCRRLSNSHFLSFMERQMNMLHTSSGPTDPGAARPEDLGYPLDIVTHLSNGEASHILHTQHNRQVQLFIDALQMKQPVSHDVAASFLELLFKDTIPAGASQMAAHMHKSQWEQYLKTPETLEEIARRAAIFFDSEEGVELGNFYTRIISRTTD